MGARLIASTTITGSAAADITFDNIPQTFRDLWAICHFRDTAAISRGNPRLKINDVTGFGGVARYYYYNGTMYYNSSLPQTSNIFGDVSGDGVTAGIFGITEFFVYNYASTTQKKHIGNSYASPNDDATAKVGLESVFIDSITPVTKIVLLPASGSWAVASSVHLYGVR